jgi:hypothetical protein
LEGTRKRSFVREGKGHACLELGREKLRNVINDGGRRLHYTDLYGPIYEEMMRMGSENPTVAHWHWNATFIKYEIEEFIKTIILKFGKRGATV